MKKVYNSWLVLILIIVMVSLYHLYEFTEKYSQPSKAPNVLGTDQNVMVPGTLTVGSKVNNKIGDSLFADDKGNIQIIPLNGQNVNVGDKAKTNSIGKSAAANQIGADSWMPFYNGSTYIRPGRNGADIHIGDKPTNHVSLGIASKINQIGQNSWFPYLNGDTYIRPGRNGANVHVGDWLASSVQIGAGAKTNRIGQDTWLPFTDGNAYIRPSKVNGVVNIGDYRANEVNLGNNNAVTNVRGQLCLNGVCLSGQDFQKIRRMK